MPLKEPDDKTRIFQTLLKVQAFSYFEHYLRRRLEVEDSELPGNELIELVFKELYTGLEYIPKCAIQLKMNYIRWGLHIDLNTSVQQFVERQRLNDLNRYLFFPD
jgi:hypothetical protein